MRTTVLKFYLIISFYSPAVAVRLVRKVEDTESLGKKSTTGHGAALYSRFGKVGPNFFYL